MTGTVARRDRANARVFDFALSPDDLASLDGLDRSGRTEAALERTWWSS
jgi:diketogulonate reductase-like aldo/keto reductase